MKAGRLIGMEIGLLLDPVGHSRIALEATPQLAAAAKSCANAKQWQGRAAAGLGESRGSAGFGSWAITLGRRKVIGSSDGNEWD